MTVGQGKQPAEGPACSWWITCRDLADQGASMTSPCLGCPAAKALSHAQ